MIRILSVIILCPLFLSSYVSGGSSRVILTVELIGILIQVSAVKKAPSVFAESADTSCDHSESTQLWAFIRFSNPIYVLPAAADIDDNLLVEIDI